MPKRLRLPTQPLNPKPYNPKAPNPKPLNPKPSRKPIHQPSAAHAKGDLGPAFQRCQFSIHLGCTLRVEGLGFKGLGLYFNGSQKYL